ncbi:MAG: PAS domain S-box protein [Desulfobacteraceae bacterium]|nr:MAG: PAS domain S-box protein [Desulfobacteraceae bacterium]
MTDNVAKIKELEKNHRLLSENLIDAIWTLDVKTLRFDYITESIKDISGFSSEEYLETSAGERLTPKSFKQITDLLTEEIPRFEKGIKNVRAVEVELIHKLGHHYWAEIKARLVREVNGDLKVIGITRDITKRKTAEIQKDRLISDLKKAIDEKETLLKENKILRGLLPICSGCKRIRDEDGKWWPLDAYVRKATPAELTHTICLDCKDIFYGKRD